MEPFEIDGNEPLGVVLVHGFTATPFEVGYLGRKLADHGFSVSVPLLPGHGTTVEDLDETTWHQWAEAVAAAVERMAKRRRVALVGSSLGGLLSLYTASQRPEVSCVASLAAPMWLDGVARVAARLTRPGALLDRVHRLPKLGGSDVRDPEMKRQNPSYRSIPTRALAQLMDFMEVVDAALPTIEQPVLVLHGVHDHTAPVSCARYIATKTHARLRLLPESYHLLAIDVERDIVATEVEDFLRRHTEGT
ncbi:MAG TPA: alpha/beta fold hydrolase [Kofleriaceae bacterium]